MDVTGKLTIKEEVNVISDNFQKREFVIEKTEIVGQKEYTDYIKFELTQDKVNLIDSINPGDEITVHFNLRGRKWEKDGKVSYFTNLQAWKIESNNVSNDTPHPSVEDEPDEPPF